MATTVNVNTVTIETGGGTNYAKAAPDGLIVDTVIQNYYIKDRHLYMMPVAAPGGFNGASVSIVQTAAPTLLWICEWTASKFSVPPPVPNPTPTDPNWVLLDDWWQALPIVLGSADGVSPLYSINGTYYYARLNPADNTNDNVVFPLVPWINGNKFPTTTRILPAKYLTGGLSDLGTQGVGGFIAATQPPTAILPKTLQ